MIFFFCYECIKSRLCKCPNVEVSVKVHEVITDGLSMDMTHRVTVLDNGSLRISNVTKMDDGLYTCVARNQFGVASSAGSLLVKGTVFFSLLQCQFSAARYLLFMFYFISISFASFVSNCFPVQIRVRDKHHIKDV